jgi:predicted nucleotidyltransferase component of viral defense system
MKVLSSERQELIDALVAETAMGGITAGLLEKDEHLTDALRALFALPLDGMSLVFCGGTSLSKAHGLIERMSEDADLKIVLSPSSELLSRTQIRKQLSALKTTVSATLTGIGLVEDKSKARALNENRYFCSEWSYARQYDSVTGLRPHLQIELTARSPILDTVTCQIFSLADHLAERKDNTFAAPTVAVAETIAEKVLSFLRRYAQHRAGLLQQDWDTALVRHIYDVHCVYRRDANIVAIAAEAFPKLVAGDQNEFGGQFPDFAVAALAVLSGALRQATAYTTIQAEYTKNLIPLIYGNEAPEFAEAFDSFNAVAMSLLATLQNQQPKGTSLNTL